MENNRIIIDTKKLTKEFGIGNTLVNAVQNVTLKIKQGEFIVMLGASGSGKTTFLSLIGGLIQPTSGEIIVNNHDFSKLSEDRLALIRREDVGIIFQQFHLVELMTAIENVELPLLIANTSKKERRPKAVELLKRVGLGKRLLNYPHEMSGGEKQRVGIARALVGEPKLILADEPTGDLDSKTGEGIMDLLEDLNQDPELQPTIIMVTHDLDKIRKGMRVLTMADGAIIKDEMFTGEHN